jgi:hypothetical protein
VLGVHPRELIDLPVTATVVGGKVVYEQPGATGPATMPTAAQHERGRAL